MFLATLHIHAQSKLSSYASKPGNLITSNNSATPVATATCTVTLVNPLSISLLNNLEFGTIALTGKDGSVKLDETTNSGSATGGVYLQSGGAEAHIASFIVRGEAGYFFTVSVPSNIYLSNQDGNSLMLSLAVSHAQSILSDDGSSIIGVGGTLSIPGRTVAGTYANSSDLTISVEYN